MTDFTPPNEMSPDEMVTEIFRIQLAQDPDSDPGDLSLRIDIQDDSALHVVLQQHKFYILNPYLGIGGSIHDALANALEKVRNG